MSSQQYITGINICNTGAGEHVHVKCYIMWQYMYVYVLWLDMLPLALWGPCMSKNVKPTYVNHNVIWNCAKFVTCSRCLAVFICNLVPKPHLLICIHCEKEVYYAGFIIMATAVAFWKSLNLYYRKSAALALILIIITHWFCRGYGQGGWGCHGAFLSLVGLLI